MKADVIDEAAYCLKKISIAKIPFPTLQVTTLIVPEEDSVPFIFEFPPLVDSWAVI